MGCPSSNVEVVLLVITTCGVGEMYEYVYGLAADSVTYLPGQWYGG